MSEIEDTDMWPLPNKPRGEHPPCVSHIELHIFINAPLFTVFSFSVSVCERDRDRQRGREACVCAYCMCVGF